MRTQEIKQRLLALCIVLGRRHGQINLRVHYVRPLLWRTSALGQDGW
jgi:hypothetical protein